MVPLQLSSEFNSRCSSDVQPLQKLDKLSETLTVNSEGNDIDVIFVISAQTEFISRLPPTVNVVGKTIELMFEQFANAVVNEVFPVEITVGVNTISVNESHSLQKLLIITSVPEIFAGNVIDDKLVQ